MNGTNPPTPAQSDQQTSDQPGFVDAYADRLMDELFTDVEQVLEGGTKLSNNPSQPDFVSLKSIQVPQIVLPQTNPEGTNGSNQAIDPEVQLRDASPRSSFDRLLLGAAFSSLVITLGLWIATRGGINRLFTPEPVAVSTETPMTPQQQANAEFAGYVDKSLTAIAKNTNATATTLPIVPPAPTATELPPLSVPGNSTSSVSPTAETNTLIQAMNRVAQAVEAASRETSSVMGALQRQLQQQQQAQVQTPEPGGQTSGASSAPQPVAEKTTEPEPTTETAKTPEPTTETAITPEPTSPAPVAVAPVPLPAPIPAPEPMPTLAITQPNTETAAASTGIDPALIHTLVGILELGDRSAALFEVNGVARRIYVGESIAGSGWTLVEVANQEAIIRRNGDVRTIFVGQQF